MQFLEYTIVGCFATLSHYSVLLLLVEILKVSPWQATMYGAGVGALIGYAGNRIYTFSQTSHPHVIAFPRFIMVAICGALLNGFLVWGGTNLINLHYLVIQFLTTLIIFILTFKFNKSWTFM